jgi:hypothetical protein
MGRMRVVWLSYTRANQMHDFVPKTDHRDVERIVRRDSPLEIVDRVLSTLETYGPEVWHVEAGRTHLACLKLANGDLRELQQHVRVALVDYRDVIAGAESPNALRLGFVGMKKWQEAAPSSLAALQEQDQEQYQEWLAAE